MSQIRNVVFQQVSLAVCYMTLVRVFRSFSRHLGTYLPGVHSFSKCARAGEAALREGSAPGGHLLGAGGAACTTAARARTRPVARAHSPAQRSQGHRRQAFGRGDARLELPGLLVLTPALCLRSMDKDSPDVQQDLNALRTKFQEMRKVVGTMPGIHLSPERQQQQLHRLREQVRTKNELLQKYKSLCMFETPKE